VRSGLVLIEGIKQLDADERLRVRVGIATGLVIVGDLIGIGAAQEQAVVGETPNLAARLQAVDEPDSGLFEYDDLGAVDAKGFAEPLRAWRVRSESTISSRFEARRCGRAATRRARRGAGPFASPLGTGEDERRPGRANLGRARYR
jgi:class 3 adenylate cyclase